MLSKLIIYMGLCFGVINVNAENTPNRIGYAYDKTSEELIYIEKHYETYQDGFILDSNVIYKDPDGNIIANKIVNFSRKRFLPEFSLNNTLTGHNETARFIDDGYEVVFSKSKQQKREDALLEFPDDAISDAGFDNFIIQYWDSITTGETFKRDFLIPSMMKFVKFRVYQDRLIEENGQSLRQINIEPDSFVVRMFAGTLRLYYDKDMPKLKRFDGVSNMRDSSGNNYRVSIEYKDNIELASTAD